MQMTRHVFTMFVVSVVTSTAAYADSPASTPPEVSKTVEAFVGKWTIQAEVTLPGAKPTKFSALIDCTKTAGGRAVYCHSPMTKTPFGDMELSTLISYNVGDQRWHNFEVTSQGDVHDHRCKWVDDKTSVCDPFKDSIDGKSATMDTKMTWPDKKTITISNVVTIDDGTKILMNGTYKRR